MTSKRNVFMWGVIDSEYYNSSQRQKWMVYSGSTIFKIIEKKALKI